MGSAVCQMEKKGIKTNIGNLNRDIKTANSLMQSIRQTVRHLKNWIAELKEKKQAIIEELNNEQKEATLPQLLMQYLSIRKEERNGWSYYGKTKGNTIDLKKIASITAYLQETKIFTLESLDKHLEDVSSRADSVRQSMKLKENKIKNINTFFRHISNYEKYKSIYTEYNNIRWKGRKQKFAETHKEELSSFKNASAYFKKYPDKKSCNCQELIKEHKQLEKELEKETEILEKCSENDYCFIENVDFEKYINKINIIIIYRWNRSYPFDKKFNISILTSFHLKNSTDFIGTSHDRITKEEFIL